MSVLDFLITLYFEMNLQFFDALLIEGFQHSVKGFFHFGEMAAVPVNLAAAGTLFEGVVVFLGKRLQKVNNVLFVNDNQGTVADQTAAEGIKEVFRPESGKYFP